MNEYENYDTLISLYTIIVHWILCKNSLYLQVCFNQSMSNCAAFYLSHCCTCDISH